MTCLVYVDASPRGEWAVDMARSLPAEMRRELVLLATEEDVAQIPGLLQQAAARLAGPSSQVRSLTAPGPAERAIIEQAALQRYALIVVPPAGRRALARMLRGSRVATVVRRVRANVLIARRPPDQLRRVLAAVSGGPLTRFVVQAAIELAHPLHAQLKFLHIAPEVTLPFGRPETPGARYPPEDAVAAVRSRLRELGLPEELLLREGLVVEEVIDQVEQGAFDLLVVGAPAAESKALWAVEDVTERIVLQCAASILVVRVPEELT